MFSLPTSNSTAAAKCYATHGLDAQMTAPASTVPKKRRAQPWEALKAPSRQFMNVADILVPAESRDVVVAAVGAEKELAHSWRRVHMSLVDVLEPGVEGFFWRYVKTRQALMLSEGSALTGNVLQICRGVLTMFLEKEVYERAGVVGKPHGVKGARKSKPRWIVEVDLTQAHMTHGKKGFERLVYAAKNVFNTPMTWILCTASLLTLDPDPLGKFQPDKFTMTPTITTFHDAALHLCNLKPTAETVNRDDFNEYAMEAYEWLSLIRLKSPRVEAKDDVDPYVSVYKVPQDDPSGATCKVCMISFRGLFSSEWAQLLLTTVILATPSNSWFSMSVGSVSRGRLDDTAELTVLRPPDSPEEYVLWDIRGSEAG